MHSYSDHDILNVCISISNAISIINWYLLEISVHTKNKKINYINIAMEIDGFSVINQNNYYSTVFGREDIVFLLLVWSFICLYYFNS